MAEEEQPPEWTMDIFRPFVESTLDEWKNDLLFVEIGLGATDDILGEAEGIPRKGDKHHPFNKIFNWIAKKISKQYKLDKKLKKTMTILLRDQSDELTTIIRKRQNQGHARTKQRTATQEESAAGNARSRLESTSHQHREVETSSQYHEIDVDQGVGEINVDLSPRQLQMKEEFEKKKKELLDSLPEEVKARFGQQYFSRWGKNPLPVLVLSPYSVPPGEIRDMWFAMYEKYKQQGRLESATNLVYWYGAYDDPENSYSFVVTKSLTPYETGIKKNMNKIPNTIQKKIDGGKKLTSSEKMQVVGLREMEEDRSKEPDERHGQMVQAFLEDWEMSEELEDEITTTTTKVGDFRDIEDDDLSSHEDKDDLEDAEPPTESDDDDEDFEYSNEPKKNPKTRTKKSKGKRDGRQVFGCDNETTPSNKKIRTVNLPPTSKRGNGNRLEARIENALSTIAKLNDRLEQSEKELENSKQQLQQNSEQMRRLKSQMESRNKEIGNLKAQYESIEEEMEQMKMNHALELGFAQGC